MKQQQRSAPGREDVRQKPTRIRMVTTRPKEGRGGMTKEDKQPRGEKFKDPRSPQELARAILDYELCPASTSDPDPTSDADPTPRTFRELLNFKYTHPRPHQDTYRTLVLSALEVLERQPPSFASSSNLAYGLRRGLERILEVIQHCKEDAAGSRDLSELIANPTMSPKNDHQAFILDAGHFHDVSDDVRRSAQDTMARWATALINLNRIEDLARSLGRNFEIRLTEPGRHK